jgi:hypothetical protein
LVYDLIVTILKIISIVILSLDFIVPLIPIKAFSPSEMGEDGMIAYSVIFAVFYIALMYSYAYDKILKRRIAVWEKFAGIFVLIIALFNYLISFRLSSEGSGFLMIFSLAYFITYLAPSLVVALIANKLSEVKLAKTVLPWSFSLAFILYPILGLTERSIRNLENRVSDYFASGAIIIFPISFIVLTLARLAWVAYRKRIRAQPPGGIKFPFSG